MTGKSREIDELDLLAYADSRLDPARAADVEAYLARRPELARQVEDFRHQDRELHAQYDRHLDQPVPARIAQLFEEPQLGTRWALGRIVHHAVAATLLMAVTGAAGWWLGQGTTSQSPDTHRFVDQAMERFTASASTTHGEMTTTQGPSSTSLPDLSRFSDRISLELRAPDLSDHGYRLFRKERVVFDGEQGVALRYSGPADTEVQVFLKSRWPGRAPAFRTVEDENVTLTYWNEGPLAVAVAAPRAEADTVDLLASKVHDTLGRAEGKPGEIPRVTPYGEPQTTTQEAGVAPDNSATTAPRPRGADQM